MSEVSKNLVQSLGRDLLNCATSRNVVFLYNKNVSWHMLSHGKKLGEQMFTYVFVLFPSSFPILITKLKLSSHLHNMINIRVLRENFGLDSEGTTIFKS